MRSITKSLAAEALTLLTTACLTSIWAGCLVDPVGDDRPLSKDEARAHAGKADPGVDLCAEFGWYGDDECDDFCALPDPDCGVELLPEPGSFAKADFRLYGSGLSLWEGASVVAYFDQGTGPSHSVQAGVVGGEFELSWDDAWMRTSYGAFVMLLVDLDEDGACGPDDAVHRLFVSNVGTFSAGDPGLHQVDLSYDEDGGFSIAYPDSPWLAEAFAVDVTLSDCGHFDQDPDALSYCEQTCLGERASAGCLGPEQCISECGALVPDDGNDEALAALDYCLGERYLCYLTLQSCVDAS